MKKIIDKINEKRYGFDELFKALLYFYVFITILNLLFSSKILSILQIFIIVYTFYRVFSLQLYKRQVENQVYLKCKKYILDKYNHIKTYLFDSNYVYHKCYKCKTILKLERPYKCGLKHTKCPTCKTRLKVFVFRKQKVDIIKNA